MGLGYRSQRSHRHYVGVSEQTQRRAAQSEVINNINLGDLSGTYAVNRQCNLTLSVPYLQASRSSLSRAVPANPFDRNTVHASGIGDLSLTGRFWLLSCDKHANQNIALGIGVKFPTGDPGATDFLRTAGGTTITRAVDQSVQVGDGGYGFILDMQAFKLVGTSTWFTSATYLFNPRDTNGVLTGRGRATEAVMSVADQYQFRLGVSFPVKHVKGMAFSVAGRLEGVPVFDVVGGSNGFRRPGYAFSLEPGLAYSAGRGTWSLSVPIAIRRERQVSVSDRIEGGHGDAAFADYALLFGYAMRLGRP